MESEQETERRGVSGHHSALPSWNTWSPTANAAAAPCATSASLAITKLLTQLPCCRRSLSLILRLFLSFSSLPPHLTTTPSLSPHYCLHVRPCPHSFSTLVVHSQHNCRHSTSSITSPCATIFSHAVTNHHFTFYSAASFPSLEGEHTTTIEDLHQHASSIVWTLHPHLHVIVFFKQPSPCCNLLPPAPKHHSSHAPFDLLCSTIAG